MRSVARVLLSTALILGTGMLLGLAGLFLLVEVSDGVGAILGR